LFPLFVSYLVNFFIGTGFGAADRTGSGRMIFRNMAVNWT